MRQAYASAALWLGILLTGCGVARALDPSLEVSQYAHTSWRVRDGFTKGSINPLAQGADGYLWVGTDFGLLRFDGVRAVAWQPPAGQQLPSERILSLRFAQDGTLFIGTFDGLAGWKDGRLTPYPQLAGQHIFALIQDHEGTIWAGMGAGPHRPTLCAIRPANMQCYGEDGRFGAAVSSLYEDRNGRLWVGVVNGLWQWKPGPPKFFPLATPPGGVRAMTEDDQGALLVTMKNGIGRLAKGPIEPLPLPGIRYPLAVTGMQRDRDGSLWILTGDHGLLHVHQGRTDTFSQSDGLSSDDVFQFLEDREGSIWVASSDGLDRFRSYAIPTIGSKQAVSRASSVLAANDGSVYIATYSGLNRWNEGRVSSVGVKDTNGRAVGPVTSLYADSSGRIWIFTDQEFGSLDGGRFVPVSGYPGGVARGIVGDTAGGLWVADQQAGILHVLDGKVVERISLAELGHPEGLTGLAADPVHGGLWIGFLGGGVVYFSDGSIRASYSTADGLGKGLVSNLRFGSHGSLWVSTKGGLSRIRDHQISTLTSKNGLPCDTVHWSIEDDDRNVWLNMPCGLVRITRSELDAWAADPKRVVQTAAFDGSDGIRLHTWPGGGVKQVVKTKDGRIWFVAPDGISIIEPHHLAFNKLPPPVHIEQVIADEKPYEATPGMRLPQHVHYLAIDYTALSLAIPEKVHFKVKLEGEDKDWRELVNVRHVEYTNLRPKHYRFRVLACNNSGVWNETGDSLDFTIPPAWYQTWWFRAACVAAFLLLLWAIYQRRVHELAEQEKKFREAVETMPALAFVSEPGGNRPFVNRGWLDYTGLSPEEASGQGWQKAIHPDDLKRVLEKWRTAQTAGGLVAYETRMRQGSDGAYRWFQTRARPLFDRRGKLVKWCAVATDIEDRKRAEQLQTDLAHVNRVSTLGELAASISHELNQPIAASIMNADLALHWAEHDPPDLKQIRQRTRTIIEMGTLASKIIDRLRSLYKKEPPKRVSLAVNEVIGEMVELLRGQATRHGVSLRADLTEDLPEVIADRVQIQQVLMNLMLNGIEAMGETGGVLTVKADIRGDGQIEISVNDTGPGLPQGKAEQIFDAFFTTKPQGSGMGLAISKSIVESHGGQIWATGDAGHGATFHFTLPPAPVEAEVPLVAT